jgi:hypothetical protein
MALYPNGSYMSRSPGRHFGGNTAGSGGASAGYAVLLRGRGDRMNRFVRADQLKTASTPDGYDMRSLVPPLRAGSMSALTRFLEVSGSGSLLQGGPMEGAGAITFTADPGGLSLVVGLSGTAAITFTPDPLDLKLVIGMDGTSSLSMTGSGNLSMIVPFDGTGAVCTFTGAGDLKGDLSMEGSWTPFTELSPENLAASVWNAQATSFNTAGTMGAKLNTASSGGVDLDALAAAVWAYATRTLTSSPTSGLTTEQANQLRDLFRVHGLEVGAPLVVTPTGRAAGSLSQTIGEVGTTVTVTRAA